MTTAISRATTPFLPNDEIGIQWTFWERLWRPIAKVADSVVGKIALASVVETVGAASAELVIRPVTRNVMAVAGAALGWVLPTAAACWMLTAYKVDGQKKYLMIAGTATAATLATYSGVLSNHLFSLGYNLGDNWVGPIASLILGGYAALAAHGSPVQFFDPECPQNSYAWSTLRFGLMGTALNEFIVTPSSPLFSIPLKIVRIIAPLLAFNSASVVFPMIEDKIKEHFANKSRWEPAVTEMLNNHFHIDAKEKLLEIQVAMTDNPALRRKWVPLLAELLATRFGIEVNENLLKKVIPGYIQTVFCPEMSLGGVVQLLARSLYDYMMLLKRPDVQKCITEYQQALFSKRGPTDKQEECLINLLTQATKGGWGHLALVDMSMNQLKLLLSLQTLIPEIEESLFGVAFSQRHAAKLETFILIFLRFLMVYMIKHRASSPLSIHEEKHVFSSLKDVLCSVYLAAMMPESVARMIHLVVDGAVLGFSKIEEFVKTLFIRPDAKAELLEKEMVLNAQYIPTPPPEPAAAAVETGVVVSARPKFTLRHLMETSKVRDIARAWAVASPVMRNVASSAAIETIKLMRRMGGVLQPSQTASAAVGVTPSHLGGDDADVADYDIIDHESEEEMGTG